MPMEEKNILIQNYINKVVSDVNSKYNNLISNELKERAIKNYTNSDKSYEDIQEEINKIVQDMIEKYLIKIELRKELAKKKEEMLKNDKIFGQTYKSILIELFKEIDDLEEKEDLDYITKKELFEKKLSEHLSKSKIDYEELLKKRTDSKELLEYVQELFLGYDSLDYDTVKKLKDIFVNDVNMVQCEAEGKLKMLLTSNQQIFDVNGNINQNLEFDFSKIKIIYDYAKQNEKMIKHHELLWHSSVPESLHKEISAIDSLNISEEQKKKIKRDMCLKFMDYYYSKLAEFFKQNNYGIRQIDVLNEIANDELEGGILRESFWSINIGDNPINGDKYFIDVLRLAKKHFPNAELIYNDYNEFIDYKCDRICSIIEYIRKIEERDGISLLDGLGLQSHYRDFVPELGRTLQPEDIMKTALKFIKLNIPLYITEFDFNNEKNSDISNVMQTFIEVYSVAANGFNAWVNSDYLTWNHCVNNETGEFLYSHIIDGKGDKKEIFYKIQNYFYGLNPETLNQMQESLNASAKKYLEIIKNDYGSYMSPEQLAFMAKLETQTLIRVEDNPFAYLEMKRKEILDNANLSDMEKKQQLSELTAPLAHGGRVYGDDVIHFYPSVLINPNKPLTLEQIQSKCDSLVVHELLHYFIRPEYMDVSNTPDLKGINGFTGEGLVDMCARDIHLKYGIHAEDYDSNYTTNVVFMREALAHISDPTERMKTIFTNSVEEVYSKTTTKNYDSKKEYEKTAKKETTFQKTISEISGLIPEHKSALEKGLMEIAANSETKEKALETIQTMGSQEQNQATRKIIEKNSVEKKETYDETFSSELPETKKPEFKTAKEKKAEREQAQSNFGTMSLEKHEVYEHQKETTKANSETKTVDKPKTLTLNKPSNPNNGNSSNGSSNSGGFVNMAFMISIILLTSIAAVLFVYHLISG